MSSGATLAWLGFSNESLLASYDSEVDFEAKPSVQTLAHSCTEVCSCFSQSCQVLLPYVVGVTPALSCLLLCTMSVHVAEPVDFISACVGLPYTAGICVCKSLVQQNRLPLFLNAAWQAAVLYAGLYSKSVSKRIL